MALLVGREQPLAELRTAFEDASSGRGCLVLLAGEPGIGKTCLADAFATQATERGARVVWGRAWEAGGAPAYWPWIEALRALDPRALTLFAPSDLADPAEARFRLFDTVARFLAQAGRAAPIVIVLDDLHAADVASLTLLHFVARSLRAARVLLIGTFRDADARMLPDVDEALAKVAREGRFVALGRLHRADVATWIRAAAAHPETESSRSDADTVADAIFASSEGNPLFVAELLRLWRARSDLPPGRLPDGVRGVIAARLAVVPPEVRGLLEVASVLGKDIDLALVGELARIGSVEVRDLVAIAMRADLLVASGVQALSERVRFSHILLREVLFAGLPAGRQAELHAQAAKLLLARAAVAPGAPLTEAVHHLLAAGPVVRPDEAIAWSRRAAERAVARLAFDEAALLLERVVPLAARADGLRCDLVLELAAAQIGAGHATRGCGSAVQAAQLARALDDPRRLAAAALCYGSVFRFAVIDAVLVGLLEDALARLPPDESALRARLLSRLAAALQPAVDPQQPIRMAREALALVPPGQADVRLEVLVASTSAMSYFAEPAERRSLDEELIRLGEQRGDRVSVLRGLTRLIFDHLEAGDARAADAATAAYERLARAVGLPGHLWRAPLLRAMRAIMQGRFDDAEALAAEAGAIAARVDDANAGFALACQRMGLLMAAGRLDEAAAHLPVMLDHLDRGMHDPLYARTCRLGMLARIGRLQEARADLDWLAAQGGLLAGRQMMVWAAEACVALGDRDRAQWLLPLLTPLAHRIHCWGNAAMICEGPIVHAQARLLALLDRADEAAAAYTLALERARALDAPALVARIERDQAADRSGRPLPPRASAEPLVFQMQRDGDSWTIAAGSTFRLRDSRGLQLLARLVASPGQDFHVTDLLAPPGATGFVQDAGEALDGRAIAGYRQRLAELREDQAEAEAMNDAGRLARVRAEIEALEQELARGVGLGGRARRSDSTVEKARVNVRQRLQDAIARIAEHDAALGKHLGQAIRTGTLCRYDP